MKDKSKEFKMMTDLDTFVMIELGDLLQFAIFLAVAIPVFTFLFHKMVEMCRRRMERRTARVAGRKPDPKLVTVIVKKESAPAPPARSHNDRNNWQDADHKNLIYNDMRNDIMVP